MYCPNSRCPDWKRYRNPSTDAKAAGLCPACHSPLLPGEPDDQTTGRMSNLRGSHRSQNAGRSLVPVMEFSDHLNAELARSYLRAHGVDARIQADDCGAVRPELAFGGGVRLLTPPEDASRARDLLEATAEEL